MMNVILSCAFPLSKVIHFWFFMLCKLSLVLDRLIVFILLSYYVFSVLNVGESTI